MKFMIVRMAMRVPMWVPMMVMAILWMKDFHDVKIASESKEGGEEHKKRLLDDLSFDDAMGCLNEEFDSYTPDYGHIDQGSQRLSFFVTER